MEEPLHQFRATDTQWILQVLVQTGAIAIDGKRKTLHA
jgi:hypothetical protein